MKAVDFFCGAGGMSCGFALEDVEILAGIDIEQEFELTYLANHPQAKFINRDITGYQPEELQSEIEIQKYDPELIFIGCSPCQYWSKVNTDRRAGSYTNNLIWDFQRFIKFFMPGHIVVENVPGILNRDNNHVLLNFLDFLKFQGYRYEYKIISTDNYGVPQHRKRFVLIGSRVNKQIKFPEPDPSDEMKVKNFIGADNGFPKVEAGHIDKTDFMHSTSRLSDKNLRRLNKTEKDGGTREGWKDDPELQIDAYKGKDNIFKNVYGRLYWDKPASTITTRFIAISCGRFAHPEENRGLSLREGATLQTFPEKYKFEGGMVSVAKQIGNAVPPELARRIAKSIIEY